LRSAFENRRADREKIAAVDGNQSTAAAPSKESVAGILTQTKFIEPDRKILPQLQKHLKSFVFSSKIL
jgi:hypothetical protein